MGHRAPDRASREPTPEEPTVLDIVYVLGIIAVFVLVGLIAKGVENL